MMAMNIYELTKRAIKLNSSITCGPNKQACDGGKPAYVCPNHGGENDNETVDDIFARESYRRRWLAEVVND